MAMPNELTYLDFEIDVSPDNASGGYTIAVVASPEGDERQGLRFLAPL